MNHKLLLPIILVLTSLSTSAEERWFEVELLLFQRNVAIDDLSEDFSNNELAVNSANSIHLLKAKESVTCNHEPCATEVASALIENREFNAQQSQFKLLPEDKLQLSAQREKLQAHASFTPVLHLAWRMPVEEGRSAKPLYLFAGKNLAEKNALQTHSPVLNEVTSDLPETDPALSETTLTPTTLPTQLAEQWEIDGNVKIYLNHYLFIDSQLVIRQQATQLVKEVKTEANDKFEIINSENDVQVINQSEQKEQTKVVQETVIKEVLFNQNRRLRSEEIHYFDHPLMGMIVQIRKIPEQELQELITPAVEEQQETVQVEQSAKKPISSVDDSLSQPVVSQ